MHQDEFDAIEDDYINGRITPDEWFAFIREYVSGMNERDQ